MLTADYALAPPAAALIISAGLLAFLVRRPGLIADVPNERSLHGHPVPRTGGIAIVFGALAASSVLPGTQGLLACAAGIAVVSLLDDYRSLPVVARLAAHLLIATAYVATQMPDAPLVQSVLLVIALAWLANLYNFMDGSDGLAGGMAVIGFGAYAAAAAFSGDWVLASFSAAVAGAALPFLICNFHPARIFMGDAGSVTLGFLAGSIGIAGWQQSAWPLIFPLLVFSPFIADATLTLARRILRREKFWRAHREHCYQKLILSGLGHRRTAWLEYLAMLLACAVGFSVLRESTALQLLAGAIWFALLGIAALLIDRRWARHCARADA